MKYSVFTSVRNTTPAIQDQTWQEFAMSLAISTDYEDKNDCPLWSPAVYEPNGTRCDEDVVSVSCLVLDIDTETEERVLDFVATLEQYSAVFHTTWSHLLKYRCPYCNRGHYIKDDCSKFPERMIIGRTPRYSCRAIIKLSRSVNPAEWAEFWQAAVDYLRAPADGQCKDISHQYFIPAKPPDSTKEHVVLRFFGKPLDVDQVLSEFEPRQDDFPEITEQLSRARFEKYARTLAKKKDDHLAELGDRLLRVCNGEPFAEIGDRDRSLFRMVTLLAERFPEVTAESIAAHFAISIERMSHEPEALTMADVIYKLGRAQDAVRTKRKQQEARKTTDRILRIKEAFQSDRTEPYRPEEYPPPQRWVIQLGNSYYFWLDGGYVGPYTSRDARPAAVRDLMPAHEVVELFELSARGNIQPKSLESLVSQYGTVAHNSVADLRAQRSYYFEDERVMVEAPCPIRSLEPKFHEGVARYFELLGGDRVDDFLMWVAALTVLDRPCAALFLVGPKGSGKSLLAYGLSRIWSTRRPTYLDEALSDFNDALLGCPLVFADENIPRDFRGFARNAELRHFIQAVTRPLNRKFLPASTLLGATRIIVAANNEEVLMTPESLSNMDVDAIAARYFYRPTSLELCAFLQDQQPRPNGWVDRDLIAKHALWLRENHTWSSDERFIIPPTDTKLHRSLTVRSGPRSSICQWLVSFLLNPQPFQNDGRGNIYVIIDEGDLLVNVQALARCWALYVTNEPCPPTGKLASALGALCTSERRQVRQGEKRINYRIVNIDNLVVWAEEAGYASEEELLMSMEKIMTLAKTRAETAMVN